MAHYFLMDISSNCETGMHLSSIDHDPGHETYVIESRMDIRETSPEHPSSNTRLNTSTHFAWWWYVLYLLYLLYWIFILTWGAPFSQHGHNPLYSFTTVTYSQKLQLPKGLCSFNLQIKAIVISYTSHLCIQAWHSTSWEAIQLKHYQWVLTKPFRRFHSFSYSHQIENLGIGYR